MDDVILICGFLGAWALVAGPVYQAALELRDEDFRREQLAEISAAVPQAPRVSAWWWLLPPVHYVLQRRQGRRYRRAVFAQLTPEQIEGLISFSEKSTAWLMVGLGGLLIAVKETWELCQHNEWSQAVYWPLVVVMAALCTANTATRMRRSADIRAHT